MELNLDLIDRAIEYRAGNVRDGDVILVRAIFEDRRNGWTIVTDDRSTRTHLFRTLVAVEDNTFGDFRVPLFGPATDLENYWEVYRFGFSCGYIPVFTARNYFCETVVVPTENDGVLMSAFIGSLDWKEDPGPKKSFGGGGGFTIF